MVLLYAKLANDLYCVVRCYVRRLFNVAHLIPLSFPRQVPDVRETAQACFEKGKFSSYHPALQQSKTVSHWLTDLYLLCLVEPFRQWPSITRRLKPATELL